MNDLMPQVSFINELCTSLHLTRKYPVSTIQYNKNYFIIEPLPFVSSLLQYIESVGCAAAMGPQSSWEPINNTHSFNHNILLLVPLIPFLLVT